MRKPIIHIFSVGIALAGTAYAAAPSAQNVLAEAKKYFQPLPPIPTDNAERAALGRRLFHENRVSQDGNVSCGHCHHSELGATDGMPKAIGVFGKANPRNAASIFNTALQFKQHWRGDRETLEEQAEKSLSGPATFGNPDFAAVAAKLMAIPAYPPAFAKAFPGEADPVTSKNWGLAVAAFERTLLTPGRFDAFLAGDAKALTKPEVAGLSKFMEIGCANCHNGPLLGGTSFQKFGVKSDYWKETGVETPDKGRADVTKNDADLYVFKVQQLRNIAKTAPYFHDGSVPDLSKAVKIMARVQLGRELTETEVTDIVAFLGALTGPVPANYEAPEPFPDAAK
jgi:cytochrome c peroxidase